MMLSALAAVILSTGRLTTNTDTTMSVPTGTRLQLENFGGSIVVTTWAKDVVRIAAEHSARNEVSVENDGSLLRVSARGRRGPPLTCDFTLTVPKWMDLRLSGVYTDVSVEGSEGEVRVETVRGDVSLVGGKGFASLRSVEGEIKAKNVNGRVEAGSVNEGIRLEGIKGEVKAETVNGDIMLEGIESGAVDASTVNGDICFRGAVRDDGHYSFGTHGGDITIALPGSPNATIAASTFNGEFESQFSAKLVEHRKGRYRLTLGSGTADVSVESFEGTIRLGTNEEKCK